MLMLHVEHLTDLRRCESVDHLGAEILQQLVEVKVQRLSRVYQDLLDSFADAIKCFDVVNATDKDEYTELAECGSLLIELQKSVFPIEGYKMKLGLTLEKNVNWCDRLLGVVRALWQKHKLGSAQLQ